MHKLNVLMALQQYLKDGYVDKLKCVIKKNPRFHEASSLRGSKTLALVQHAHLLMQSKEKAARMPVSFCEKRVDKSVYIKEELKKIRGRVLVLTGCSKSKIGYNAHTKVEAHKLYTGRLFKSVKQYSKLKGFDLKIISAKYGLIDYDTVIEGYEKVLKTKLDIERIKPTKRNAVLR